MTPSTKIMRYSHCAALCICNLKDLLTINERKLVLKVGCIFII